MLCQGPIVRKRQSADLNVGLALPGSVPLQLYCLLSPFPSALHKDPYLNDPYLVGVTLHCHSPLLGSHGASASCHLGGTVLLTSSLWRGLADVRSHGGLRLS